MHCKNDLIANETSIISKHYKIEFLYSDYLNYFHFGGVISVADLGAKVIFLSNTGTNGIVPKVQTPPTHALQGMLNQSIKRSQSI